MQATNAKEFLYENEEMIKRYIRENNLRAQLKYNKETGAHIRVDLLHVTVC